MRSVRLWSYAMYGKTRTESELHEQAPRRDIRKIPGGFETLAVQTIAGLGDGGSRAR